jgi:molybdopterin-containing oxidoreductase family membrane subunit
MNIGEGSIRTLAGIMRITILINLVMMVSEIFTSFYTGGAHGVSAQYLYFGHHGKHALVPWIWTSATFMVISAVLLMRPNIHQHLRTLDVACVLVFIAIWIEKGMGLIIPGFIPSTLHEWVEYLPSATEWKVTAGIWAGGLLIYTLLLKVAIPVFSGDASGKKSPH